MNLCHAMCVMQTCQGSARYRIREIFLNVLLSLREEGTLQLFFSLECFYERGGGHNEDVDMMTDKEKRK